MNSFREKQQSLISLIHIVMGSRMGERLGRVKVRKFMAYVKREFSKCRKEKSNGREITHHLPQADQQTASLHAVVHPGRHNHLLILLSMAWNIPLASLNLLFCLFPPLTTIPSLLR